MTRPIITLTTDFGQSEAWVGQMKGTILGICPEATVVDLAHGVPPQDVRAGAYLLECGAGAFPPGTIHVGVVDPGVGTARRGVVLRSGRALYVGPDNGLFSRILEREGLEAGFALEASHLSLPSVSPTFAGRDVFAPAAAWLARGIAPESFGPPVADPVRLFRTHGPVVPVILVDRFGNVVLDVRADELGNRGVARAETPAGPVTRTVQTFAEAGEGEPVLLVNSAGYLEIAVREGRADERLGLARGSEVTLSF